MMISGRKTRGQVRCMQRIRIAQASAMATAVIYIALLVTVASSSTCCRLGCACAGHESEATTETAAPAYQGSLENPSFGQHTLTHNTGTAECCACIPAYVCHRSLHVPQLVVRMPKSTQQRKQPSEPVWAYWIWPVLCGSLSVPSSALCDTSLCPSLTLFPLAKSHVAPTPRGKPARLRLAHHTRPALC